MVERDCQTVLYDLVRAQKRDNGGPLFTKLDISSPNNLFIGFQQSFRYRHILSEASKHSFRKRIGSNLHCQALQEFRGQQFQDIAFLTYSSGLSKDSGLTLLSPENTLKLYTNFYPGIEEQAFPLGSKSLRGVSVPDGVILQKNQDCTIRIVHIFEYTLAEELRYFTGKYEHFLKAKSRLGAVLEDTDFVFLVPGKNKQANRKKPELVDCQEVPFTIGEFNKFSHYTWKQLIEKPKIERRQAKRNHRYLEPAIIAVG